MTLLIPPELAPGRKVTVVVAHPDDETFGLGAIVSTLTGNDVQVRLTCLTRGEASTLGRSTDLAERRVAELGRAATILGIESVEVRDFPDGSLRDVPLDDLAAAIATADDPDAFVAFDIGGVTGHADHARATEAALSVSSKLGIPLLGWALPAEVASTLNQEFTTNFEGYADEALDHRLTVDRSLQLRAMACHNSQLGGNPIPHRRLALQGEVEHLRVPMDPGVAFGTD